jgi:hypothetical protein
MLKITEEEYEVLMCCLPYAYKIAKNPDTNVEMLEFLAHHPYTVIMETVAVNPSTPVHVLVFLSKSEWELVRIKVASSKNCPPDVIDRLSQDANQYVREMALTRKKAA